MFTFSILWTHLLWKNIWIWKRPLLAWYATLISINTHFIDQGLFCFTAICDICGKAPKLIYYFIQKLSNHSVLLSIYWYLPPSVQTAIQKGSIRWGEMDFGSSSHCDSEVMRFGLWIEKPDKQVQKWTISWRKMETIQCLMYDHSRKMTKYGVQWHER